MPGEKYGILLQPQFENGGRKTLGGSFHTSNNPNMQALREHFEPIIAQQEDEYNEDFCLETRVKIVNLFGVYSSSTTQTSKTTKTRTTQSAMILEAIQQSNVSMQAQTNAILQSNAQILEAMRSQTQAPTINWTPLIQAVATAIPAVVGVSVQPVQTPATQPITQTPTPQTRSNSATFA
jgi:hypothetical protein